MNAICIVGSSNSGKTTLIEKVVPILKGRGLKVLAVKHAKYFELDRRGKDSWRLFESGADVVITSKEKTAYICRFSDNLDEILDVFGNLYDIVLIEGFRSSEYPKIVLLEKEDDLIGLKNVIAVVSNTNIDFEPKFNKEDYHSITKFILDFISSSL